eukprot:6474269-Lingulodinium_polyedra.AAC.1
MTSCKAATPPLAFTSAGSRAPSLYGNRNCGSGKTLRAGGPVSPRPPSPLAATGAGGGGGTASPAAGSAAALAAAAAPSSGRACTRVASRVRRRPDARWSAVANEEQARQ